jgi:hypothetical protein
MTPAMQFSEILEALDRLTLDEQEALVGIVQRRLAEQGRRRVVADVQESRREFAVGACRPATTDELMGEI